MDAQTADNCQLNSTNTEQVVNIKAEVFDDQAPELLGGSEATAPALESDVEIKNESLDDGIDQLLSEAPLSAQSGASNLNDQVQNKSTERESHLLHGEAVTQIKAENSREETNMSSMLATPLPCGDAGNLTSPNNAAFNPEDITLKDEEDDIGDDDVTPERVARTSDDEELMSLSVLNKNTDTDNVNVVYASESQPQPEAANSNADATTNRISVVSFNTLIESATESIVRNDDNLNCSNREDIAAKSDTDSEIDEEELPSDYFDELLNSPPETKNIKIEAINDVSDELLKSPPETKNVKIEAINDVSDQGTSKATSEADLERKLVEYKQLLANIQKEKGESVKRKHSRSNKKKHHKNTSSSEEENFSRRERSRSQNQSPEKNRSRKRSRDKSRNKKRRRSQSDIRSRSGTRRLKKERASRSRNERRRRDRNSDSPELRVRLSDSNLVKLESDLETVPKATAITSPPTLEPRERKLEKAILRVKMQQKAFRSENTPLIDNRFVFTQTMKPKPTNANLKNPSPLCSLHNVTYVCTSSRPRVPLSAYGLCQPTKHTVNVMRKVCIGSKHLDDRGKLLKMPPKMLKMLKTANEEGECAQRDAQCQTDSRYFNRTNVDVATQYCNENLIDIGQMNDKQKYAIFLCEEMMKMLPNTELNESQQNRRLIEAIRAARDSLKVMKGKY